MIVYKFGGASVRDAGAVRNVAEILRERPVTPVLVVVSAMGKTTNALERVVEAHCLKTGDPMAAMAEVRAYHSGILQELFANNQHPVYDRMNNLFVEIEWVLDEEPRSYDFVYDQIVSMGELMSSTIISEYLIEAGVQNDWVDVRDCIITDNTYREGKVDWEQTSMRTRGVLAGRLQVDGSCVVTQGFIASTSENFSTTLGREGSDYTAAILAHVLDAESVTIWKDVPGVLNADPKYFAEAQKLEQLSYQDAIELAYYGASVIHPKTIKPLENKGIPLWVKSFLQPQGKGTVVGKDLQTKPQVPSYIFKSNQVLISISAKDFSFIAEDNLSRIFGIFAELGVKMNLIQNSAISFSVCADEDAVKTPMLIDRLRTDFRVRYNSGLQLYTIRYYYPSTIETVTHAREVLLEQRSRTTAQLVMKQQPI